MSVYDKVQHTMFPFNPVSQEQQAWIGRIADSCAEFCASIGLDEPGGVQMVSFVLQTAGEMLWKQSGGMPCWSRLNVDGYVKVMRDHTVGMIDAPQMAVHVLTVFYKWLGETKQLGRGKAIRKVRQLLRHCRGDDQGTGSAAAAAAYAVN